MRLRDFYCEKCGDLAEDIYVDSLDVTSISLHCAVCRQMQAFNARCNGGQGKRYRLNDWPTDPEFYRGQIKAGTVTAKDSFGNDARKYNSGSRTVGDLMANNPKYINGTDEREERREVKKHATRRKRGTLPMTFDQKGA